VWFDDKSHLLLQIQGKPLMQLDHHGELSEVPATEPPSTDSTNSPSITTTLEAGGVIRVWRGEPGQQELCAPLVHGKEIALLLFDPARHYLATLTKEGQLRVWELATALLVTPPLALPIKADALVWDSHSDRLAAWSETGVVFFDW
jgi:WD40 repeat protein